MGLVRFRRPLRSDGAPPPLSTFQAQVAEGAEMGDGAAAVLAHGASLAGSASDGVDFGDAVSASLTVAPPADVVWGALGDSQTDEYQGDDERGPAEVLNWLELLVQLRGLDFGVWSDTGRGEPRREGYEYNWARSGVVMSSVIANQLAGLAAQVEAGTVTHAVLFMTGNEWVNFGPQYAIAIYNGDGTETSAGTSLATVVSTVAGQATTCMDDIDAALDTAGTGGGMVVVTPPDYMSYPAFIESFPNATRRGWVAGVVEDIYDAVAAYAATLNTAAGYTRFSVVRTDETMAAVWASADGQFVTASGVQLDYDTDWEYDPVTYDPFHYALAPTTGSAHIGTIAGAEFARAFIQAANQLPGISIDPLLDAEILEAAGASAAEPTPDIQMDFDYASTSALMADADPWVLVEDMESGGDIVLDTTVTHEGNPTMRYDWDAGSVGDGRSISRQLDVPDVQRVCVEFYARFPSDYQLDFGHSAGVAYKFLFVNVNGATGRFEIGLLGAAGTIEFNGPGDVADASRVEDGPYDLTDYADDLWHRHRFEVSVLSGNQFIRYQFDDGAWMESNGQTPVDNASTWTTSANELRGVTLGRNMNHQPTSAQSHWWASTKVWWGSTPGTDLPTWAKE